MNPLARAPVQAGWIVRCRRSEAESVWSVCIDMKDML